MSRRALGIQLIEMMVAVGMIGVLALASIPVLTRASDDARAVACTANLNQVGRAISDYYGQQNALPTLCDLTSDDPTRTGLREFMGDQGAYLLRCPSDETPTRNPQAPSYRWYEAWNGINPEDICGMADLPLLIERDSFHGKPDSPRVALMLFGDNPESLLLTARWVDPDSLIVQPD